MSEMTALQTVVVFTPWPVLTVTIEAGNTGQDELHIHAGGQGVWIARMLARLGVRPLLCAPFGGETGGVLRNRLEEEGLAVDGITVREPNGYYLHDRRSGTRHVLASSDGRPLNRHEADDLYGVALVQGLDTGIVVLAGQRPPGIIPMEMYGRLSRDLRTNGCKVVGDLSGEALASALEGGLDILKVSHEEAGADGWVRGPDRDDLLIGIQRLLQAGAETVVMSRGPAGILASSHGQSWEIDVPRFEAVDFRGAGDSMTAGLAVGLASGLPPEQILRLAAAAGSLNVSRRGLGTGQRREIDRLAHHIRLRALDLPSAPDDESRRRP